MKKKPLIIVLIVVTIISIISNLFYGYKLRVLQNKILEVNQVDKDSEKNEVDGAVETLDSLIVLGDYQKVLEFSKKLDSSSTKDTKILWRSDLISDFVELKKTNKRLSRAKLKSRAVEKVNISSLNTKNIDSLKSALINSLSEITRLKKKINSSQSNNEYLIFKTTKGIKLHYVGSVKNKKANGYGIALLESGSRYEGSWKNNLRHGHGNFYWDDGEHYEGTFVKDRREGIGTYFWNNGDKYVGHWEKDKRSGKGNFYNKKGKLKASGVWVKDKLVEED